MVKEPTLCNRGDGTRFRVDSRDPILLVGPWVCCARNRNCYEWVGFLGIIRNSGCSPCLLLTVALGEVGEATNSAKYNDRGFMEGSGSSKSLVVAGAENTSGARGG